MFRKLFIILTSFVALFFLAGCVWSSEEKQQIEFFKYILSIPVNWEQIDPALISVKQIDKKVKLAYKDKDSKDNLTISYSEIKDKFFKENDIIQAVLAKYKWLNWYQLIDVYSIDITCGKEKQKLYIHVFDLKYLDENKEEKKYYFVQWYLIYNNTLITISFLTNQEWKVKIYEDYLKTLKCKQE